MIQINRRLKLIEAINYCEKYAYIYNVTWSPIGLYEFRCMKPEDEVDVFRHLEKWEVE